MADRAGAGAGAEAEAEAEAAGFGSRAPRRGAKSAACCRHPFTGPPRLLFASFHTYIHEKFMTVSLVLLVHLPPPHPPSLRPSLGLCRSLPHATLLAPINPLRERLSERM